jgi:hypothetical protein
VPRRAGWAQRNVVSLDRERDRHALLQPEMLAHITWNRDLALAGDCGLHGKLSKVLRGNTNMFQHGKNKIAREFFL